MRKKRKTCFVSLFDSYDANILNSTEFISAEQNNYKGVS